ncbi:hypothetical protein RCL_jg17157.t1 [Rhizophagus clarus]|uniref:Uncharacterized protein n=1 Tax=Rhizophagus clarus TaxID=94130 RepID=A0A8H3LLL9_9GLOM|nr:hypothetical protein RCL_jg17157.t1 [Rhizophagus clarus]
MLTNKANVHTALIVYLSILTSQNFLAEISFLLEEKVGNTVSYRISRADQNLVNSDILHQNTQQTSFKSVPDDQQSLKNLPVNPDDIQVFPDLDTVSQISSLSILNAKLNKSKKAAPKSIEKVYVNQIILNDKMNNVRDIFVYDIFTGYSHAKIIVKLKDSNCWQLWNHNKPSTIFNHYSIKALKHFNSGGKSQIVAYFKKYQNVEFCRKPTFNFNHNSTNHSLSWCTFPIFLKNKNKQPMKNSHKQNSSSFKAHSTNFKPTKDQAKSSKKSKNKNKKKSLDKKSNDKMDIVKFLLALIS